MMVLLKVSSGNIPVFATNDAVMTRRSGEIAVAKRQISPKAGQSRHYAAIFIGKL